MPNDEIYDCFHDPPEVEPYGDVSGVGVLTGFLGTAYLVVLIVSAYYLFAFDPEHNHFRAEEEAEHDPAAADGSNEWRRNPIDELVLQFLRSLNFGPQRWGQLRGKDRITLAHAFEKCVRSLIDAQIVTGIGILVSGFGSLKNGLSAYHWQLIVYLAWFANLTHISGLTFLRNYLQKHRDERNWRLAAMGILLVFLIIAEVPTGFFNWSNTGPYPGEISAANSSSYASCFFEMHTAKARFIDAQQGSRVEYCSPSYEDISLCLDETRDMELVDTTAFQTMILSTVLLIFSFATRTIKLSKRLSTLFNHQIRDKISNVTHDWIETLYNKVQGDKNTLTRRHREYMIIKPMFAVILLCRLYADLYTSMLSEVFWLIVSTVWGSIHLFTARHSTYVDESELTFGQILPIFLLIGPLIPVTVTLVPVVYRLWKEPHSNQRNGKNDHVGRPHVVEELLHIMVVTTDPSPRGW
ncbi:hypothetical protein GQ53DRAFT_830005 [Thozetella sp. PMI_491]|nr:hypothetical protein GQ53DRAFT_830005 [Thozetella sp. PMI_491]